ncbi:MAG: hypothetical protein JNM30_10305, partial [Rhodospirillales bacterium]|nr:hypothetical protein [Rhodospirillales bacterium]
MLAPVSLGTRLGGVGWVFLAPAIVLMAVVYIAPLFDSFAISFHPNTPQ